MSRRLMRNWLVVNSQPNRELYASAFLTQWGIESYVPRYLLPQTKCEQPPRSRIFFPGYFFVRDREDIDPISIQYAPGVSKLVRSGAGSFARVSDEVVNRLKRKEAKGFIQMEQVDHPYAVGERVWVEKPTYDVIGRFMRLRDDQRAVVLLSLLGSSREAVVDLRYVKKAA